MSDEVAVQANNLTKIFKLYNSPVDRLKESLHPLRRQYHHIFYALDDISFEIRKGDSVGIIGKNGSGKSTLLKILAGVITPTKGSIHINGKISALLELGAGFSPELSGLDNIYFNGMLMGFTREELDAKLDDILSFADIGEFVQQPVKTYSSGMFVRLAFAVAVNVDPDILIVDEALAVGDLRFQKKCKVKMNEFREQSVTIILVSHSMADIVTGCNKSIYLKEGRVVSFENADNSVKKYLEELSILEATQVPAEKLTGDGSGGKGGTGDIIIEGMQCYSNNTKNYNIGYGENIVVEAEYTSFEKINRPIFRISLSIAGYRFFTSFDITYEMHKLDVLHGKGTIRCQITNPNIYPNAYTASIAVLCEGVNTHLFYWIDACRFVVTAPAGINMYNPYSIIQLNCSTVSETNGFI